MGMARVGMGMPVYNGERYLEEAIRANLAQTYGDFTLLISDNASTDRTEAICRDYAARDKRIRYVRNPVNVGAAANFDRCFRPLACEYFRWSNADDIPEPTLVEKCLASLEADPTAVLAYGKSRVIDAEGAVTQDYDDNLDLRQPRAADRYIACVERIGLNNVIYGLMRRDALARTALLKGYPGADIYLVAELSLYGAFREIPERLFSRRMHPQASSWKRDDTAVQMNFWDPLTKRPALGTLRALYESNKAILRAPVPPPEKARVLYYLLKKAFWSRSAMIGDVRDLIRYEVFGRMRRKPAGS